MKLMRWAVPTLLVPLPPLTVLSEFDIVGHVDVVSVVGGVVVVEVVDASHVIEVFEVIGCVVVGFW